MPRFARLLKLPGARFGFFEAAESSSAGVAVGLRFRVSGVGIPVDWESTEEVRPFLCTFPTLAFFDFAFSGGFSPGSKTSAGRS
jgi:hypothetical protein